MHIDARNLENNTVIKGDICIVGAGAAGISMALDWINTPYKVILLEGGGFEYDEKVHELYAGKTTGQKYFPLKSTSALSKVRYFGLINIRTASDNSLDTSIVFGRSIITF